MDMTGFDIFFALFLWAGIGNGVACYDWNRCGPRGRAVALAMHGRRVVVAAHFISCFVWPLYFVRWD